MSQTDDLLGEVEMLKRYVQGLTMAALVVMVSPAQGQTMVLADNVPIYLNGDLILRLRAWDAGLSPTQRADALEPKLKKLFDGALLDPAGLEIRSIDGEPCIFLDGVRLVTVTEADARANGSSASHLAASWKANFDAAIRKYNVTFDDGHRTFVVSRHPLASTTATMLTYPEPEELSTDYEPAADMKEWSDNEPPMDADPMADAEFASMPVSATDVTLNGVKILIFRTNAGGFTPQERYVAFQNNLQAALNRPVNRGDVQIRTTNGQPVLYLGGQYLCTVTEADALANGTSARMLAGIWANNLRRAVDRIDRY